MLLLLPVCHPPPRRTYRGPWQWPWQIPQAQAKAHIQSQATSRILGFHEVEIEEPWYTPLLVRLDPCARATVPAKTGVPSIGL